MVDNYDKVAKDLKSYLSEGDAQVVTKTKYSV